MSRPLRFDITGDESAAMAALEKTAAAAGALAGTFAIKHGGAVMFERYTDRARRVIVLAQEEARLLNHNYIGTEHLLLGLIHEGEGVAAKALKGSNVVLEDVRKHVEEIVGPGQQAPTGHIPFTPRGKKVMEYGLREALLLGHNYIGTEHLLLGLIREGQGVGAQVLEKLGADLNRVRQQVMLVLGSHIEKTPESIIKVGQKLTPEQLEAFEAAFKPPGRLFAFHAPQPHASGHLSDALRDLAPRVHEDISRTEHTVTEDKLTGEVVETLTVRWKREKGT